MLLLLLLRKEKGSLISIEFYISFCGSGQEISDLAGMPCRQLDCGRGCLHKGGGCARSVHPSVPPPMCFSFPRWTLKKKTTLTDTLK